jgi:hypothetical protein
MVVVMNSQQLFGTSGFKNQPPKTRFGSGGHQADSEPAVRLSPIYFLSVEDAFLRINRYLPDLNRI